MWSGLALWSPKAFVRNVWSWPDDQVRPLAHALITRKIAVNADGEGLKLLSLRFDGSMDERQATPDSLKGKLFLAEPGDVVFSKIDVRNGAIGIVPPTFDKAAFTAEFPIYRVRPDVADSRYIQLLFRSNFFRATINGMVSGASGRKRIAPDQLEAVRIPLPLLSVQQAIVSQWQALQDAAQQAAVRADACEAAGREAFLRALGLVSEGAGAKRKGFALNWSRIGRWGVDLNQPGDKLDVTAGHYPVVALGDAIADLANGWSPKCLDRPVQGEEWGVLKLGAVSFGAFNAEENKALPASLEPVPALQVLPGDWLISRANVTRLVGACALVKEAPPRLMLCDKIFRAVWRADAPALPAYLDEVLKTPHLRQQIEAALTGTSPTMKNISKPSLLALRLPLPPLNVQANIVTAINEARAEAVRLRIEAAQLRQQAQREIEAALLGHPLAERVDG